MGRHHNYAYVADTTNVWDEWVAISTAKGQTLGNLRDSLDGFVKSDNKQLEVIDRVPG